MDDADDELRRQIVHLSRRILDMESVYTADSDRIRELEADRDRLYHAYEDMKAERDALLRRLRGEIDERAD